MYETALGMIENFLHLVDVLGFVPNGGRIYYENRSQPPLLTQMVWRYFQETQDFGLLNKALPLLDVEYNFWMTDRVVKINGYSLNIFNATNDTPRPGKLYVTFNNFLTQAYHRVICRGSPNCPRIESSRSTSTIC